MRTSGTYDVIVIGVGGMGSATVYELARRGLRVLGLDRFSIPNDSGSSHGVNRIIRLSYFEDSSYVPLLRRSYERWRELEEASGEKLLYITGSVDTGREDGRVVAGALRSCREHDLAHEALTSAELTRRFPGFRFPESWMGVYQPDGGFVLSERCIVNHVFAALERGGDVRAHEAVLDWSSTGDIVRVRTSRGLYEAGALVVTAGAWAGPVMPSLDRLLVPERQVLGWFQPLRPALYALGACPVVIGDFEEGHYYSLPVFGIPGYKIGKFRHLNEATTADGLDRDVRDEDEAVLRTALARYFPDANGPTIALKPCMFTNTPDGHFIIDALPGSPNVFFAAGFSGHGFKFCSVVGEIMADLSTRGETGHDISFLRLSRFDLQADRPHNSPGRGGLRKMATAPSEIAAALKRHRNKRQRSDRASLPKEVGDLVYTNPFAFLVGVAFDRGMPWQKAWEIPYWMHQKGLLEASTLAEMEELDLQRLLESLPIRPRYGCTQGARTLSDAAKLVMRCDVRGDAAAIWDGVSPLEVQRRLESVYGIGPGIAHMAIRILRDDWGKFRGEEHQIDVKPDVHVMRVFKRAGLTQARNARRAVEAARELNPRFPGELDWPAWDIGIKWCRPTNPHCGDCPLTALCPKRI